MIDTRCCRYCGIEFSKVPFFLDEGTFTDGYCSKFHRKDHEKQLIREGKLSLDVGDNFAVLKDTKFRDSKGERIWFPKDGKPYFDQALRKTFNSIQEKSDYMKKNKIFMDGSSAFKNYPIEAGDVRDRSYRRRTKLED